MEEYKILAFITLLKKYRTNSVVYSTENKKVLAKSLGISYNSYKKYFDLSVKKGLIIPQGNNFQAINLVHCIIELGLRKKLWKYNNFFNSHNYEKLNFKNVYNRIVSSVILVNYSQQAYLVDRNEILFSRSLDNRTKKLKLLKGIIKKAEKLNTSTEELLQSIKESKIDKIVSGKNHVARLTGFSQSSGLRWMNKLDKEGIIKRKVEIEFIPSYINTFADYDFHIKNITEGKLLPVVGGFKHFKGSSILLSVDSPVKTKSQKKFKKGLFLIPECPF